MKLGMSAICSFRDLIRSFSKIIAVGFSCEIQEPMCVLNIPFSNSGSKGKDN